MMFAELTGLETAGLICSLIFGAVMAVIAVIALLKKQEVSISPQPLNVEVVKALHEQFANKADFDKFVAANEATHKDIFSKVGGVQRGAASDIEAKVETVRKEVTSIGKDVAALQATTILQNQSLARIENKLDNR